MSRIRVGIVGTGGRGTACFGYEFTTALAGDVEVVALADVNRTRAEVAAEFLGIRPAIHDNAHDLLARKDIDAVVITTPDSFHEALCVEAFKRGKHVLVDKPLAITAKGCLNVIEASRRSGKLLYMGFNMRHNPVCRKMRTLIDEGLFGEVFSVQAIEHYDGGRTYMARWNRLKKYTGSLFIHKGSHDFDIINWFMGQARPVKVSCFANVSTLKPSNLPFKTRKGVKPGPTCTDCPYSGDCPDTTYKPAGANGTAPSEREKIWARMFSKETQKADGYARDVCIYLSDKDTHDQGIAIVEYDNGATASHSEYFATPLSNRRYLVEGQGGHADADLHAKTLDFYPRWSADHTTYRVEPKRMDGHGGADSAMCIEFVQMLKKGLRPSASGIDGAWSVAIGEACEKSRVKQRMVKITEVLDIQSDLLK
jgi:predicted dehydrogenase